MTKEQLIERLLELLDSNANDKELLVIIGKYRRRNEIPNHFHEIVLNVVCDYYSIILEDLLSKNRSRVYSDARKIISKILRDNAYTYMRIGRILNRDHSAIIHNYKSCCDLVLTDGRFCRTFENIETEVNKSNKEYKL